MDWLTDILLRPVTVVCGGAVAFATPLCWAVHDPCAPVFLFYVANVRADVFNGSLTLSGFLLSVLTFIVTSMKTDVYDTESYADVLAATKALLPRGHVEERYGPLRRLTRIMASAVFVTLLSGILHVTLVYAKNVWAVATCGGVACAGAVLAFFAVLAAYVNFRDALTHAENEHKRAEKEKAAKAQASGGQPT